MSTVGSWLAQNIRPVLAPRSPTFETPYDDPLSHYKVHRAYYHGNDLYDAVSTRLYSEGVAWAPRRGFRTPANRVVEFHTSKLWAGDLREALPLDMAEGSDAVRAAIEQVWTWSNWGSRKQAAARTFAMLGDMFLRVMQTEDRTRVYIRSIDPEDVTSFTSDYRGYLTECRIDVFRVDAKGETWITTEAWDKERYRRWRHQKSRHEPLGRLGTPVEELPLSAFGINFVPIVHAMFRDVGNDRGAASFTHAIDKMDEANILATRLHQMLFRYGRPSVAITTTGDGRDKDGRPLPKPLFVNPSGQSLSPEEALVRNDDDFMVFPAGWHPETTVPNVNYPAMLSALEAMMNELEDDLPELTYSRLRQMGANLSGIAVRRLLGAAVDRVIEARGNATAALIRADQMALTIGAAAGLPQFKGLGTYEAGDFDHRFRQPDPFPADGLEKAQEDKAAAEAALLQHELGVSEDEILRSTFGFTDTRIEEMKAERAGETQETLGGALLQFDRGGNA